MKLFVCLSLALFAAVTATNSYGSANPSAYGGAPAPSGYGGGTSASAVQQVSLAGLANLVDIGAIEKYLNAPASSHHGSNSASYAAAKYVVAPSAPSAGPVISSSYSAAPAPAAASHGAAPAAYGAAPATYAAEPASYAAAPASYAAAPLPSYGGPAPSSGYAAPAAPKYQVLPAYVSQINAGKNNYKTYQTPIQYSTVTLPVAPAGPVANLYVPENAGYGSGSGSGSSGYSSSGSSYGGASY